MKYKAAGIVTFNPEINRLNQNVNEILPQIDSLIIIDNDSSNFHQIREIAETNSKITIVQNNKNYGIATALNQICSYFLEKEYEWVTLLDQDSIVSSNLIDNFSKYINIEKIGLLTPYIVDTNKTNLEQYAKQKQNEIDEVNFAITSGSMINLRVWEYLEGFDEKLFIDCVDLDYSKRLSIEGFKQIRVNSIYLLQEVGRAERTLVYRPHKDNAGKWTILPYYRTNHSIIRQYYMLRNHIILLRKFKKHQSTIKTAAFILAFTLPKLIFEGQKIQLLKKMLKAITDGLLMPVKVYEKKG